MASPGCGPAPVASGAIVAIDDQGDTLRLAAPAARIVSLSPATTELLFAIGAGDRLVGRTRWCDFPSEAQQVPSVGDGMPPNVEAVLAARPDLILLYRSAMNQPAALQFRRAGVPTFVVSLDHLADVPRLARTLGGITGTAPQGDSLAHVFERALADAVRPRARDSGASRPAVLLLAWDQPPIAIGAGSFQSEIVSLAGGRNLFADLAAPSGPVTIEAIAARDPDVVLLSDSGAPEFAHRPEWRVVPAVREGRFVRLGNAFGRPSPRAPALVRELSRQLDAVARPVSRP